MRAQDVIGKVHLVLEDFVAQLALNAFGHQMDTFHMNLGCAHGGVA